MSEATKPAARRRALATGLASDSQAVAAMQDLAQLDNYNRNLERLDLGAPLRSLHPSPKNPRRRSLDAAGVTLEKIDQLKLQPGESVDAWRNRYVEFLRTLTDANRYEDEVTWSEMFDTAENIRTHGLLQPIIAQPDGEIIAGERRWTSCLLAGLSHERVIYRLVGEDKVGLFRLIENINRSDLSLPEITLSLRSVMAELTTQPLGVDNMDISLERIKEIFGCKKTRASQFLSLCRLPEGDPLLAQILSGGFGGLRAAYEAITPHLSNLRSQQSNSTSDGDQGAAGQDAGSAANNTPPTRPQSPRQSGGTTPKPAGPQIKVPMPGEKGGARLLKTLKQIEELPADAVGAIDMALTGWAGANDSVRKKMLMKTLEAVFGALDAIPAEDSE